MPGRAVVLAFGLGLCLAAEVTEEDGVLVLSEANFNEVIKTNSMVLVEFYAPWCGHCKQLAPEYARAAQQLKNTKPPVPLAKLDAMAETKLAEKYGVRGYPTLRLFVDGRDQEYTGGRTEQGIVTWVLKKAGPPAMHVEDVAGAEAFVKEHGIGVIGFFDAKGASSQFTDAARMFEDLMFGYTTSPQVAAKYEVTPPAIRMHFPHDEKVALLQGNPADAQAVETFVRAHRHPLVVNFSGEVAPELFADGRPILFLFRDKDEKGQAVEKALAEAAPSSKRRVLFSVCGSNEPMDQRLMDYVGVEPEDLPTARLVSNPSAALVKYKLEGEITASSLSAFVEAFEAGTLKPHLRSQPPPASQPGPVKVLVGSTFRETAMDPTKDVLIEFYAPWCGHCKKLEPVYRDLAKKLESVQTLVIAKMDVTENDAAGLDIQGFPTIKFWRGDKKDDPLDYDGDRDVDSFVQWLEEKVTHPFNREELKNEL